MVLTRNSHNATTHCKDLKICIFLTVRTRSVEEAFLKTCHLCKFLYQRCSSHGNYVIWYMCFVLAIFLKNNKNFMENWHIPMIYFKTYLYHKIHYDINQPSHISETPFWLMASTNFNPTCSHSQLEVIYLKIISQVNSPNCIQVVS